VDSDSRLAFTAAIRKKLTESPSNFNPRDYLAAAMETVYTNTMYEIINIMGSAH
jgi:fructose-bisphosphate aldolase class II